MLGRSAFPAALSVSLGLGCLSAHASDPLDLYFGAAVGRASVRVDQAQLAILGGLPVTLPLLSRPFSFTERDTGWKVQLGARLISLLGAEIEYVDFGTVSAANAGGPVLNYLQYQATSRAKAVNAFAVGYAPIPLPFLDVYGKVGGARLQTTSSANGSFGCLANCPLLFGVFNRNFSTTRFVYSLGVQLNVGRLAARAEYERIATSTGDPDLLSIGAILKF